MSRVRTLAVLLVVWVVLFGAAGTAYGQDCLGALYGCGEDPAVTAAQEAQHAYDKALNDFNNLSISADSAVRQAARDKVTAAETALKSAQAALGGDPVLLTTGRYYFEETDIEIPGSGFAASRLYTSEYPVTGSLGKAWVSSFDSRIIRGRNNISEETLRAAAALVAKIKAAADKHWSYASTNEWERQMDELYESAVPMYEELERAMKRGAALHGLNGKVLFPGTPAAYEDVGNEKLVVVDGDGAPVIRLSLPEPGCGWR